MIALHPVRTKQEWKDFIDLPWTLYQGNHFWAPPLRAMMEDLLNVQKNPFFKHAQTHPLLARKDGKTVGRIMGIIDEAHCEFHQEKTSFFGFFESIEDSEVARLLFKAVKDWSKTQGMTQIRGPIDLSTNDTCGLLVEGFEDPPAFLMNYHLPYYATLIEQNGFHKTKDLLAYELEKGKSRFSDRLLAHSERVKKKASIRFREIDLLRFEQEVDTILEIYNDAWEKNWGFVPMNTEEFRHKAKEMKPILDPRLCLIVEVNQIPAAFSLALPDINQVLQGIPDGKLFPSGFFKLIWNLKGPGKKKTMDRCRILTLGVKKQFQEYGLGPLLYTEYLERGPALGYPRGEASWILEDNRPMCRALELMGAKKTKTYRLYDHLLTEAI